MSFAQLKKNRSNSLEKLSKQLENLNSKTSYSDPHEEKFWKPTLDKAGNAFAIIRFLPAPEGEDVPFIRIWDHGFKGPGGWYIEKSLTSIGKEDPLAKINTKLWNSGNEADKEVARIQKRRLKYIANILVIKDPANPDNDGKTFLFSYGKKIFDKLNDLMNPSFEDEKPTNPFDFWEGTNFRLKIRQFEGYPNYDKSDWEQPSALFDGDDEKLEKIYKQLHSLQELLNPKYFKSYEELEAKLHKVLGLNGTSSETASRRQTSTKKAEDMVDEDLDMSRIGKTSSASSPKEEKPSVDDEEDEDLAFFKELASK
jgi:hypothetical protein